MSGLEELFGHVDDFCQAFEPKWKRQLLGNGLKTRNRRSSSFPSFRPRFSQITSPSALTSL